MTNVKRYNIFIFFSSFARNIIEVFSAVFLYKNGYNVKEILLFYFFLYLFGISVNIITILINKKINAKYILILSSLLYCFSYYYLSIMVYNTYNLIIFSLLLAVSSFSYHALRHYFAIKSLVTNKKKGIGNILIISYIALTPASLLGAFITTKYGLFITIIIILLFSVLGIIPLLKFNYSKEDTQVLDIKSISKNRILFFILEQFKVVLLLLMPLYIFIYIGKSLNYIGLLNLFICISSVSFIFIYVKIKKQYQYFKYLNILFCLTLIIKINITGKIFLLIISIFEGLGIKLYELISTENLYHIQNNDLSKYLIFTETIFCISRCLIFIICYLFINNIKIILYICIFFIFISGLLLKKEH